jgi:Domain of unknown function (DUF4145)
MIPRTRVGRTSNPDTPPDSTDPTGPCPRCGRVSNFEFIEGTPLVVKGHSEDWSRIGIGGEKQVVAVLRCMGCNEATAVIEDVELNSARGEVTYSGIFWWPLPASGALDPAIPQHLRDVYSDADKCLAVRVPAAAGVMFRRCLEGIVRDKGSQQTTAILGNPRGGLKKALDEMASDTSLHPELAKWAGQVRLGSVNE